MIILLIVPKIKYYKLEVVGNHAIGLKPMFMFPVICAHWTHGGGSNCMKVYICM